MICPKCGAATKVINSRSEEVMPITYRKQGCGICGHLFWTIEMLTDADFAKEQADAIHKYKSGR